MPMLTSSTLQNQSNATMVQSASKNETLGTYGATIDTAKALSVARQDGVVAAETVNQTADLRNMEATGSKNEKWDAKKVAKGGALANVAKDFSAMGTVNAMNEKGGEGDFFAGSMKQGREGANKTIAEAANRERKFALAKSLVDGKGKSISFSAGIDGHIGQMAVDGVQKISSGTEISTGAEVASMIEGHNLTNKDKVSLDANGHIQGSQEARKSFAKFLQTKQYTEAQIKGILGEAGAGINSFVPEEYQDLAKDGLLAFVGSVAAYKFGGKQAYGFIKDKLSGNNAESNKQTSNNSSNNTNSNTSDKTNPESHIESFDEKLKYSKDQINESRASIENYSKELEAEQAKKNPNTQKISDLQESIVKETDNLEANKRSYTETYAKQQAHNNRSVFEKVKDTLKPSEGLKDLIGKGIKGAGVGLALDEVSQKIKYFSVNESPLFPHSIHFNKSIRKLFSQYL